MTTRRHADRMAEPSAKNWVPRRGLDVSVDGGRKKFSAADTIRQERTASTEPQQRDRPQYPLCASCGLPVTSGIAHANEAGCIAALRLAIQYEKVNRQARRPSPQGRARLAS